MKITPDDYILYSNNFITLNRTIISSWIVMIILITLAVILRIYLKKGKNISKIQGFFEIFVNLLEEQVKQAGGSVGFKYIFPFMTTLFTYIIVSNLISLIPYLDSPTSSLSTTLALSIIMFLFSFFVGFKVKGIRFLKKYLEPTPFMLPLNIIGNMSNVVSLSFRLYGNVMSSGIILIILSKITFLSIGVPVVISLLSIIIGVIQSYIFFILSMIFVSLDD